MNVFELAERDLKKVTINLEQAKRKPNVSKSELQHLEELYLLRSKIIDILNEKKYPEGK